MSKQKGIRFYEQETREILRDLSTEEIGAMVKSLFNVMCGEAPQEMNEKTKEYFDKVLTWQNWGCKNGA